MGWAKDGSGLMVYRNRGRTVAQRLLMACDDSGHARDCRRFGGWFGNHADWARGRCGPKRLRADCKRMNRQRHEPRGIVPPF